MLFNSMHFLIFFPIVLMVYYLIPNSTKHLWLLAASYYFYMCWNVKYVLLIITSTTITYMSGIVIETIKSKKYSSLKEKNLMKCVVGTSAFLNLGILFYYKYMEFTFELLTKAFRIIHIELNTPAIDIILPIGISFYTFQALSYTIDVYRGDICAEKDFLKYALFVSFFPQLVAGPIERSKSLLKQLSDPKRFDFENVREGFLLIIWGYFLKLVLADRIAIFVDMVYKNYTIYIGWYIVTATVLFAIQIYCDFAGYSTIAMGAAKMLGIDLMDNFNAPYLSISVEQFWRNWHISLTSWFKDYLYIPLGGNRKGNNRKYVNKMIVFLASGLWHGANLSFVIWGGLNGLYQLVGEMSLPAKDGLVKLLNLNRDSLGHKIICGIITFILVDFSWIFFRASGFNEAIYIIRSMFLENNVWIFIDGSLYNLGLDSRNFWLMIISIFVLLFVDINKRKNIKIRSLIIAQDLWCRYLVMIFAICFILVFGIWGSGYDAAGFIYFQF